MSKSVAFDACALVGLRRVAALTPRPDGSGSVAVVERLDAEGAKYVSDLWLVPHDGGAATQLTRGDWKDRAPAFLDDGTLLFLSDRPAPGAKPGEEARAQIWALPPAGEAYALSDEPHGVADFKRGGATVVAQVELLPGVALDAQRKTLADKKKLGPSILRYAAQPVRFWDRWLGPTEPRLVAFDIGVAGDAGAIAASLALSNRRELTADAGEALRENSWDLSADGARVATTWGVIGADRIHDRGIAVIDTADAARTFVGAGSGIVHAAPRFTPDATRLVAQRYLRTPDGYAHRTLWCYRVDTVVAASAELELGGPRESSTVAASGELELTAKWDRWPAPWAVTDEHAVTTAEDEGRSVVFLVDLASGAERAVAASESGSWDQLALVPGRAEVVGVRSDLLAPPEPFHLDLASGELRPLARLSGFVPPDAMPVARKISVDVAAVGARARTMSAFVVEPPRPNGRTLLWIHGGPVASWSEHWHWRWSALTMAEAGYRVVQPNPSGSTGFGMDWINDIWGNTWGERCFDDLMRLVARLEADGIAARDIAVMGGSFGGYMTNWIGTQTDRFRALVTHASLYDLSAFHAVTDFPAWWELMMRGAPWSDTDYDRYSPSRFVRNWKTPALIIHGDKDYRVPIGEALALFEALQAHGVVSELAIFPDENHWILKPNNAIAWYDTVLDFLERVFSGALGAT